MSDDMPPRAMPHDIQAEMGVLGSMLLAREAVDLARERLTPESFFRLTHQAVFAAILHLIDATGAVDLILLRDELKREGKLEEVGGVAAIIEIMESVPTSSNVEYYAAIVGAHATRRGYAEVGTELVKAAFDDTVDLSHLLEIATRGVALGAERRRTDLLTGRESVEDLDKLMAAWESGDLVGVETGIKPLDKELLGLLPGTLNIIGGMQADGKTALASNITMHLACQDKRVLFFSAEMRRSYLQLGLLSILSGVPWRTLRQGRLTEEELECWTEARLSYEALPILIDDTPSIPIEDLCAQAVRHADAGVELIVVDYVQLLRCGLNDQRNRQVAFISSELKRLARETGVPVLALSQVTVTEGKPHLRHAQELMQDGDVIIYVFRDGKFSPGSREAEPDIAERWLKIEKNKFGPGRRIPMWMHKPVLRFEEAEHVSGDPRRICFDWRTRLIERADAGVKPEGNGGTARTDDAQLPVGGGRPEAPDQGAARAPF